MRYDSSSSSPLIGRITAFLLKSTISSHKPFLFRPSSSWCYRIGLVMAFITLCRPRGFSSGLTLGHSIVNTIRFCIRYLTLMFLIVKEHVAIIIMSSTAANSATAIQVISVQDCEQPLVEVSFVVFTLAHSIL